jgi:lipopolysaccharide/colanic/teichoic acid biosynthesis glycosyltransferase
MTLSRVFQWFGFRSAKEQFRGIPRTYHETDFNRILARERSRVERSNYCFSLVAFEIDKLSPEKIERRLFEQLKTRMRTSDEAGWIRKKTLGVILHNATEDNAWKFANGFLDALSAEGVSLPCTIDSYPPPAHNGSSDKTHILKDEHSVTGAAGHEHKPRRSHGISQYTSQKISPIKRLVDIIGASLGLAVLSPLFLLIWLMVRIISPGPAIYKQFRVGLGGRHFVFWKFRTMKINAETSEHRQYLAQLIHCDQNKQARQQPMAKLDQHNSNIIPFGRVLRRTCLDELPQLINVLRGDMSLIGPRPPIPYEVEEYKLWHNGRLDVVPGMTGLWQVSGKNRLTFEQMVRLDIQYVRKQSLGLDLKILCLTPMAIANEIRTGLQHIGKVLVRRDEEKLA